MLQDMIKEAVSMVTEVLITVAVSIMIAFLLEGRRRVLQWIDTRKEADTRELLHRIASEGFTFAESVFREYKGSDKMKEAIIYVNKELRERGIEVSSLAIEAAVERAVLEHNAKMKTKPGK